VTSIGDAAFYKSNQLVLTVGPGSYAEKYAIDNQIDFVISAVSAEQLQYYAYSILEDGAAEITGYSGSEAELVIPSMIDGHKVTSIGKEAFYGFDSLTSVIIPDSVTSIGEAAFIWCSSLTSVAIPDSVAFIGDWAFHGCDQLVLTVGSGSYAEKYAKEMKLKFVYR